MHSIKHDRRLVSFRQWKRKGYAVFSSLGRQVRIGVLSVVYSLVVQVTAAQEGEIPDTLSMREVELDEVVVTAGRSPVGARQAVRQVTIISRSDIERAPAQSLSDLLRFLPSADIRQRGPLGAQADISIRGGTYDQTLILLNGINVSDPQTGHHHLNLPVDPEGIRRIEFLKGSAARIFGPNAFSGVINVITGSPRENHLHLSASAGAFGLLKASGNIALETGKITHFFSSGYTTSDGYTHNTDFSGTSLFYQAERAFKKGNWSFQSGMNSRKFGANSFYSLKYPEQYEATGTLFISAGYRSSRPSGITAVAFLRRNRDRFELIRNNPVVPFNHHLSTASGANLNYAKRWTGGTTSLGVDFRREHILSTVLGNPLHLPRPIPGEESLFYTRSADRLNMAMYAEHRYAAGRITLTPGVMANYLARERKLRFYPGVDGAFRLTDGLNFFGSLNRALRMPTFTDLYYTSPVQLGNPLLKPEEAFTTEGGIRIQHRQVKGMVALFHRQGSNMIDWVKDPSPDSLLWRSMNHTRVSMQGVEFSLNYLQEGNERGRQFLQLQGAGISWTMLDGSSSGGGLLSRYTLDYLRHQAIASLEVAMGKCWNTSLRVSWRDRHGAYPDREGRVVPYEPVFLADARVNRTKGGVTLFVEASNLLNVKWEDFGGIRQPGSWISAGVKLDAGL